MFVSNLMLPKEDLITVTPDDSLKNALEIIQKNDFLSIPVVERNKFYGSIPKERILSFYYTNCLEKDSILNLSDYKVKEVMRTGLPTVNYKDHIENAAHLLDVNKAAFVAVLDESGTFKGIITHHAIFKEFTELFGFNKGKRLAIIAYDIPGQISKLTKIISENKGDIISCVVEDPRSLLDVKEIVMRINTDNYEHIITKVVAAGFKVQ